VFNEDFTLAYWAGTRVKESTAGEWMKTVKNDGSFQLRTPRQMASGVGVTVQDGQRDTRHRNVSVETVDRSTS